MTFVYLRQADFTPTMAHGLCRVGCKGLRYQRNTIALELMRKGICLLVFLFAASFITGCNQQSGKPAFTADVRIVAPFMEPPVKNGKLYMSKGRLRVELGPMSDVYIVEQKKGWRMFPEMKQYLTIGEKDVSTYLPPMTNGSPCPTAELPSACKPTGKESIEGRSATKWEGTNHNGVRVYFWTDDKLQVAVRWEIENVTYELRHIREGSVPDSFFELPAGYTPLSQP